MANKVNLTPLEQKAVNALSAGPITAREAGVTTAQAATLVSKGMIVESGTRKQQDENGIALRGRPSRLFKLTRKGKNRVAVKAEPVAAEA